jgi:hypothetical protein
VVGQDKDAGGSRGSQTTGEGGEKGGEGKVKRKVLEMVKAIWRKGGGSRASAKKAKEKGVLERERLLLEMKFGKR